MPVIYRNQPNPYIDWEKYNKSVKHIEDRNTAACKGCSKNTIGIQKAKYIRIRTYGVPKWERIRWGYLIDLEKQERFFINFLPLHFIKLPGCGCIVKLKIAWESIQAIYRIIKYYCKVVWKA